MTWHDAIKTYLLAQGWQYKGSCHCSGMLTYKFEVTNADGEYKLRVRKAHFLISKPGKRFIKLPIIELKETIDEISKVNKATV